MRKIKLLLFILIGFGILLNLECYANHYSYVHIVDYASPTPLEQIKSKYSSKDFLDGDITNQLVFRTDYNETCCIVKDYELIVSVTNSKNKTTTLYDIISVRDFIAPSLSLIQSELTIDISQDFKEILQNNLIIKDNLDTKFDHIIFEGIEEIYDGPGDYTIRVYVIDSSTNKSNIEALTIHAYQSIYEEILPNSLEVNQIGLSKEEILSLVLNSNVIPPNYISLVIESNYFTAIEKSSVYQLCINTGYEDGTCVKYYCLLKVNLTKTSETQTTITIIITLVILFGAISLLLVVYWKRR